MFRFAPPSPRAILPILLPLLFPLPVLTQESADARSAAVDALFAPWHTPDSPGAVVLVMVDGKVLHARGYGMANLEHGVPNRPGTVMDVASVSKQFGAMAVALLEAEGLLSLDDDVRLYIPDLPDFGRAITLRHLVHHTSGLRDWPGTLAMAGWSFDDVISFQQILRMAYRQRELNFPPGTDYAYSNTGYNLLAEVVERVSGRRFQDFTRERIFLPLGMRNTRFPGNHREVVPGRADSYTLGPDGSFQRIPSTLTALGSSSLLTTVEDLALWVANLATGEVGGEEVRARIHQRGVLAGGDTLDYAFGQSLGEHRGLVSWSHTGSWAGFRSILQRFPQQEAAVVILANTANMDPSRLAAEIAELYLGDRMTSPPPEAGPPAAAGAVEGEPTPPRSWEPAPEELQAYAGRYHSPELDATWELAEVAGRLLASHFRLGFQIFDPQEPDHFAAAAFGEVRFIRDEEGRITGFSGNSPRIRGLLFWRVE